MKLKVLRFSSQEDSTSGLLFEDTDLGLKFLCYTLEDERRALKVKGETRVPAGIYNLALFKRFWIGTSNLKLLGSSGHDEGVKI